MPPPALLEAVAALADVAGRHRAVREVALRLGADDLLLFVRDPELGVLLPAPGFPPTLRGGTGWRSLLASCDHPGTRRGEHCLRPGDPPTPVLTHVGGDGVVLVVLGGAPPAEDVDQIITVMPLLGAALRAEAGARIAEGDAAAAREAGRHAQNLARALDTTRAELERSLRESARLNIELEEAGQRKDEFLAMLGHELRNPMAGIIGALELIRLRPGDSVALERAHRIIDRQSRQLMRLIDDLLDVARVTRGKIILRPEPLDVNDAVRGALEAMQSAIASKGHCLNVVYGPPLWAMADPMRLEQIITNLLTNAAKYTDEGGLIEVTVVREEDDVVVRVRDSGIGIAPGHLARIFEPFVQVPQGIDRSQGGIGIGLTLVKRLAMLHGGRAEVASEEGKGSVFTLRIPVLETAEAGAPNAPASNGSPAGRRILVVDDDSDSADMISELLTAWGHHALQVSDGSRALHVAAEFRPDVVLLDIGLPGLDGYEVAKRLQQMPELNRARIVAMTGYGRDEDREKARAAGFVGHLVKPIDFDQLRRLLGDA